MLDQITLQPLSIDLFSLGVGGAMGVLVGAAIVLLRVSELEKVKAALEARMQAERQAHSNLAEQQRKDIAAMEEKFTRNFENLSHRIFDEKTEKFKILSQESLNQLLSPLKEKLSDFHKKVDDSFGQQAKEQYSLKEQIERIVLMNKEMTTQTENLTRALKSDVKKQGSWGEIILEKILEDSGLRKGVDYRPQGEGMGLRDSENRHQKPDMIILLPEKKHIIIDSKVSLTHYEKFVNEEDDIERAGHLKKFIGGLKSQVGELEKRKYQDTEGLGTPDFVLMFLPIEGAYMLALQEDPSLQDFAWNKKVVIVCPSTLFATLRTVESVWRLERQNQNALEIARQGGGLYDKVAGFVADMQKLGAQLGTMSKTYGDAMNKLSQGQGNILKRTEDLKALGAKASKSLPPELLDTQQGQDNSEDISFLSIPPKTASN